MEIHFLFDFYPKLSLLEQTIFILYILIYIIVSFPNIHNCVRMLLHEFLTIWLIEIDILISFCDCVIDY